MLQAGAYMNKCERAYVVSKQSTTWGDQWGLQKPHLSSLGKLISFIIAKLGHTLPSWSKTPFLSATNPCIHTKEIFSIQLADVLGLLNLLQGTMRHMEFTMRDFLWGSSFQCLWRTGEFPGVVDCYLCAKTGCPPTCYQVGGGHLM
jgi:hypothetical protein